MMSNGWCTGANVVGNSLQKWYLNLKGYCSRPELTPLPATQPDQCGGGRQTQICFFCG